ncbi:MAG: RNA polymerase sigma factor [Deltaproteobacteria bacterium]|nr:RNA polymerase sigma factor [Deltaproteobacteria bacterium]MBN2670617.1 RNA polymerase sigma factor [Deltaproteobacteria bacterium]
MSSNGEKEGAAGKRSRDKDMTTGVLQKIGLATKKAKPTSVSKLVKRCQEGDTRAFQELFQRHVDGVHRHLMLLLGPHEDVDDLVQLVFLNVFQSISKFRGTAAFSTWLFRITINVARQEIRVKSRHRRLNTAINEVNEVRGTEVRRTPETRLASIQEVYEVLDKLSSKKRETFILYTYEGYSLQEIAELLDSSVSTIGSRLQAARKEILSHFYK